MGERRAACRGRSRKPACGSWSCSCSSVAPCRCGGSSCPRAAAAAAPQRCPGLHGSSSSNRSLCSYRRLIHGFEDVVRRRLRSRLRTPWFSPSFRSGVIVTTQKNGSSESDTLLLTVLFPLY